MAIDRYIDDNEQPCCAKSFPQHEVCPFYITKNFGIYETCNFSVTGEELKRRFDETRPSKLGTLIPIKNCPIWYEDEK